MIPIANAAILFEPDGYSLTGPKLMGRQSAGNGFLRAAVAGRQGQPLFCYTPHRGSAEAFARLVRSIDPTAEARWLPADRPDLLGRLGTLYLPGPGLEAAARLRLRAGPAAYSLCGVTHTLASHGAMEAVTSLLAAPVMPWDALVCTSTAAAATVQGLLEEEGVSLRWRFGPSLRVTLPLLPVIPLGVHGADFSVTPADRAAARAAFGIAEEEVVALFVGRLSFHAKAHPHAMYAGLQAVARRTSTPLVLLQSGRFANDGIAAAFREGAARTCPDVRALFLDGKDPTLHRQGWAAADLFVSLSDNIQETFGLTPIEAMAAGLPAVVTDWNGYKDTVRDGVDGFRIPTWMPPPGLGEAFARGYESGMDSYDLYCGLTCQMVPVDIAVLTDRLTELVGSPDLRRRMGEAGRRRACETFDWAVVYPQYQALWRELGRIREAARTDPAQQALLAAAPRAAASRMDPLRAFAHYSTAPILPGTLVSARPGASAADYAELAARPLFAYAARMLPPRPVVEALLAALAAEDCTVQALAERTGLATGQLTLTLAVLAKMGLVRFRPAGAP